MLLTSNDRDFPNDFQLFFHWPGTKAIQKAQLHNWMECALTSNSRVRAFFMNRGCYYFFLNCLMAEKPDLTKNARICCKRINDNSAFIFNAGGVTALMNALLLNCNEDTALQWDGIGS